MGTETSTTTLIILLHAICALAYFACAGAIWLSARRNAPAIDADGLWRRLAPLAPLALHAMLLYGDLIATTEPRFGFGYALSAMLWLAVAIYWIESLFVRADGLQAFALPLAGISVLLPLAFPGFALKGYAASAGFRVHLFVAIAAYSFFTIAALQAILMAALERRLRRGTVSTSSSRAWDNTLANLPPLLTLERTLFHVIGIGFALLTFTILSGLIFSEQVFGRVMRWDHKTMFAIVSWMIFGLLLAGRWRFGWRGRTALRWVIAGFACLILAYVGSRFVIEVILQRTQ